MMPMREVGIGMGGKVRPIRPGNPPPQRPQRPLPPPGGAMPPQTPDAPQPPPQRLRFAGDDRYQMLIRRWRMGKPISAQEMLEVQRYIGRGGRF